MAVGDDPPSSSRRRAIALWRRRGYGGQAKLDWARQTSGGSPHYYGVQTISSTQLSGQACSRYGFFERLASEPSLGIVLPDVLEVGGPPI